VPRLRIYGDFNCPFSALASARSDVLLGAAGAGYEVDWRAVQHDPALPPTGTPVRGRRAEKIASDVARVRELSTADVRLQLAVPARYPNTTAASAAYAAATATTRSNDAHEVRRRLFAALWAQGCDLGNPGELEELASDRRDDALAQRWQDEFDALPQQVTPTVVLDDGTVIGGFDGLAHLAELVVAASSSSP
jgi:predicted DsbA family dithiol-disulfide isomerase